MVGDLLCAVPALRALRRNLPQAHIALVGLPWAREFVERFSSYLDEFIEFPGYPGLPEREFDEPQFQRFLEYVRGEKFDLALQLHGSGPIVNPLVEQFHARLNAGFYLPGEGLPPAGLFFPYPDDQPEVLRNLSLITALGLPAAGRYLEWPVRAEDFESLASLPEASRLASSPYICIHPGSRYLSRRWLPERFAEVADALAGEGWQIVLTGTKSEREVVDAIEQRASADVINLAGRTDLASLGALLSRANLLISNDTGVSHLAAALRLPSVVIVTGSDPHRWAPLDRQLHRVALAPIECRPCDDPVCPIGMKCATAVSVDQVFELAREQLQGNASIVTLDLPQSSLL